MATPFLIYSWHLQTKYYPVWQRKIQRRKYEILLQNYTRPSHYTKKIFLKRKLYTLRMAESTIVTDHINTLKTLFSQLTTLGHNIEENERAELLLQSLPDLYDQLIINLTNNNPVDNLVFDDVAASVLNEESRRKNTKNIRVSSQQVEALSVTRGRSTEHGPSGSQNHGRSKFRSQKNVKCYKCGKKWHVKKECWTIGLKTVMEMWTGKPTDYSYLHAFGCPMYVMYNAQKRTKFDTKSRRCIFLGYVDGVKRYRLWDPTAHKIVINRDVIFIKYQLQMKDGDDGTVKEKSETVPVYVENNPEDLDSSEAAPEHEEQEPVESKALEVRRSTRERRPPAWHSEYVTEINVAYCLLTEDGEPSTFRETLESSDIKRDGNDQVERYRARLVVKGYAQKEGIDFNEIFSPVVRLTTVKVVLAMCATLDLHLEQLDVKTAFLHRELEKEIYMLQPERFVETGKENLVCRLNKSLYGLQQVPRCWYKRFDSFIMSFGYNKLSSDHCAYYKRFEDNDFIILLLYVDNMLVAGPNKDRIQELKAQLAREFEMKDLGPTNKILRMQIHRDRNNRKIWLSQKNYLKKILRRFIMQDLGSLMFAMICTRPDITQAVGAVSRYMTNPGGEHWIAVKRILKYIRGTSDIALCYRGSEFTVRSYVDLDFAGDIDKRKSTIGYMFTLAGAASALHIVRNPAFHSRRKHIRVQYHIVREVVEDGNVDLQKIHTKENLVDVLTKPINTDKFVWSRFFCGLTAT
ncbi:hypothetical protein KPL70_026197 [Citrus sinensis]|nr:hypothetical protein KPL70_026197 [Citrus sinensis]